MLNNIPGVTFKMFCSWPGVDGGNCPNEAVGDMPVYLDNNPLPGKDKVFLPICQIHVDLLDKQREK